MKGKRTVALILSIVFGITTLALGGFSYWEYLRIQALTNENVQLSGTVDIVRQQAQDQKDEMDAKYAEKDTEIAAVQATVSELENEIANLNNQLTEATTQNFSFDVSTASAGTIVSRDEIDFSNLLQYFTSAEIKENDAVYTRIHGKSYVENDNIALSDLRYIKVLHYNFEHQIQVGELIMNASVAEDVLKIFNELFRSEYEIQSLYLIDNYWTGDAKDSEASSIEHNNSCGFCYRAAEDKSSLSNHALGLAFDLNPQQNPYVYTDKKGNAVCDHENAKEYITRDDVRPHMITDSDAAVKFFGIYGFTWGGDKSGSKDYKHFEKTLNP